MAASLRSARSSAIKWLLPLTGRVYGGQTTVSMNVRNVRYGSSTDISRSGIYVCFTPDNGRGEDMVKTSVNSHPRKSKFHFGTRPFTALALAMYVIRPSVLVGRRFLSDAFSCSTSAADIASIGFVIGVACPVWAVQ